MNSPKYLHDCCKCKFLGHINHHEETGDGYICGEELIIRLSDEGCDYASRHITHAHLGARHGDGDGFPELLNRANNNELRSLLRRFAARAI